MKSDETCHICKLISVNQPSGTGDVLSDCLRCGKYLVSHEWIMGSSVISNDLRPYLSAATRQASEAGRIVKLTPENWRGLAEEQKQRTIAEKLDMLLRFVAEKTRVPGGSTSLLPSQDFPLFAARDGEEIEAYFGHLESEGLLKGTRRGMELSLTIAGWQLLEPRLRPGGEPGRCFVAMWFDDALDVAYEQGMDRAIRDCDFTPYRVKEDPTNKAVMDRVLTEIRRAQFVVADFTGHRSSVYYEAGFAHGIGREVISTCCESDAANLTFDTRHLGHVVWKDIPDLRTKLANSIRANIIPKG